MRKYLLWSLNDDPQLFSMMTKRSNGLRKVYAYATQWRQEYQVCCVILIDVIGDCHFSYSAFFTIDIEKIHISYFFTRYVVLFAFKHASSSFHDISQLNAL